MSRVVIDTNIFVSALMNANGAPRQIIRMALQNSLTPIMGTALFHEYLDVLSRKELYRKSALKYEEREQLFQALLSKSQWVSVYFLWRPNLTDEADNHLIELAVAGNASAIISANKRDFKDGELLFPDLHVYTAGEYLNKRSLQ